MMWESKNYCILYLTCVCDPILYYSYDICYHYFIEYKEKKLHVEWIRLDATFIEENLVNLCSCNISNFLANTFHNHHDTLT